MWKVCCRSLAQCASFACSVLRLSVLDADTKLTSLWI